MAVLAASMIKAGFEDYKRHKADRILNQRKCTVVTDGKPVVTMWQDVVVGDVLRINKNESFPADLLLLASNDEAVSQRHRLGRVCTLSQNLASSLRPYARSISPK